MKKSNNKKKKNYRQYDTQIPNIMQGKPEIHTKNVDFICKKGLWGCGREHVFEKCYTQLIYKLVGLSVSYGFSTPFMATRYI